MSNNRLASDLDHILDHTRNLWDLVRGERIFITGGTGFIGCWLLESLIWANQKLGLGTSAVVLSRSPQDFVRKAPHLALDPAITLLEGNVCNFVYPDGKFPFIIHAATEASAKLNEEKPLTMLDTITGGTRHVLDFSQACAARRFLLTSSGAVYGEQPPDLSHIPETYSGAPDPLDRRSAYGQGKRIAEHLCALYSRPGFFDPVLARCFAFVGPYLPLDIHYAIGNFIRDGLLGATIKVNGDGTPYRSYLYAADLAIWLWKILLEGKSDRAYNVGAEAALSIAELARQTAAHFDPHPEVLIVRKAGPGVLPKRYVPATLRARTELGLQEWIGLDQAIRRTVQYHQGLR